MNKIKLFIKNKSDNFDKNKIVNEKLPKYYRANLFRS